MRAPRGFWSWPLRFGQVFIRERANGTWVVLATSPDIKVDNMHRDGRPHLHVGGWQSADRRDLRPEVTMPDVVVAIAGQLETHGRIDVAALLEALG